MFAVDGEVSGLRLANQGGQAFQSKVMALAEPLPLTMPVTVWLIR